MTEQQPPTASVAAIVRAALNGAARELENVAELLERHPNVIMSWPDGGLPIPELSELAAGLRAADVDVIRKLTLTFERRLGKPDSPLELTTAEDDVLRPWSYSRRPVSEPAARSFLTSLDLAAGGYQLLEWLGEEPLFPTARRPREESS